MLRPFLAIAALLSACTTPPEAPEPAPEPVADAPAPAPAPAPDIIYHSGPICELVDCAGRMEIVYGKLDGPPDFREVATTIDRLTDIGSVCVSTGARVSAAATQGGREVAVERYRAAVVDALGAHVPPDGIETPEGVALQDRIGGIAPPEPLAIIEIELLSQHHNPDCR